MASRVIITVLPIPTAKLRGSKLAGQKHCRITSHSSTFLSNCLTGIWTGTVQQWLEWTMDFFLVQQMHHFTLSSASFIPFNECSEAYACDLWPLQLWEGYMNRQYKAELAIGRSVSNSLHSIPGNCYGKKNSQNQELIVGSWQNSTVHSIAISPFQLIFQSSDWRPSMSLWAMLTCSTGVSNCTTELWTLESEWE